MWAQDIENIWWKKFADSKKTIERNKKLMEAAHEILSRNYKETSWVFAMNFSKQKNKASLAKQIDTLKKDLDCA